MIMLTPLRILLLFATSLVLIACSSSTDKGPAELAIKAAEQAVNASKDEATKYVPADFQRLETALSSVKANFAKGDYKDALSGADNVTIYSFR